MKIFIPVIIACCFSACTGNNKNSSTPSDQKTTDSNTASAPASSGGGGTISCKLDGKDWSNSSASATQTGKSFLNIASDENQKEAISIIETHPATGAFSFNKGVSGSYTDAAGKSYGSKDGGMVIITNYLAPADNKTDGLVEGTFSGTFSFDPATSVVITDGKFSMPVKKL